jgi:flavin reductase (DIM6/NTAB) family NADH-FMN oxidoreductase RutF
VDAALVCVMPNGSKPSLKEDDMSNTTAIDSRQFRKALGSFTTGVTVVTTRGVEGEDIGLTANSFNSVSLDPPMVLWSLDRKSSNAAAFMAAEHFAVHIWRRTRSMSRTSLPSAASTASPALPSNAATGTCRCSPIARRDSNAARRIATTAATT